MGILNNKILVIILTIIIGVANAPVMELPKGLIYGRWKSDKPLYNSVMELTFDPNGKYVELLKDIKTNRIESKYEGTFIMVNDSVIKITSKTETNYHKIQFITKNLIRFYSTKNELKESVLSLYVYKFIRDK